MIRLMVREVGWQVRLLLRNPLAVLLVVVLPVVLLPLIHALNPGMTVQMPGGNGSTITLPDGTEVGFQGSIGAETYSSEDGPFVGYDQFLVPALVAFGVAVGCFANLAIGLTFAREDGTLKRLRGTPLPPWVHLAGRVAASVALSLVVAVATVAAGVLFYDIEVPWRLMPGAVAVVALGAAVFCALGVAVTRLLPNGEAAPAAVFAVLLPMAFVSNSFFPPHLAPDWMERVAGWLPLEPFTTALVTTFNVEVEPPGLMADTLSPLGGWMLFGAVAAVVWFRWVPRSEAARPWTPLMTRVASVAAVAAVVVAVSVGWASRDTGSAHAVDAGPIEDFPVGEVVHDSIPLDGVRGLPAQFSGGWYAYGRTGEQRLDIVVYRTDTMVTALEASGCDPVPPTDLDPEWLAALGVSVTPAAVLADPCSGTMYDGGGVCVTELCEPQMHIPAEVQDGRVVLRLDEMSRDVSGFDDRPPIGTGASSYHVDGLPGTTRVACIIDESGVRFLSPPVVSGKPFELGLSTRGPLAGTLFGIDVGGQSGLFFDELRWLSLPVGQSDESTTEGQAASIARVEATRWRITFAALTIEFATDRLLPPWLTIAIDTTGNDLSGQPIDLHLRLVRSD